MTSLSLQTAPANDILTLSEVKTHLRVDGSDEDTLIQNLIAAATSYLDGPDGVIGRALINQTWDWNLDSFPASAVKTLTFPLGDVRSITSITYVDINGVTQTWADTDYNLDQGSTPERLYLSYGRTWPETRNVENAVTVRFVAGFGSSSDDIPASIKQAALLLIGTMYCNREVARSMKMHEVPFAAKHLIAPFKRRMY